uniref:Amino acid transporter transmembrane domain-containing protein n=1 Tax=Brassica campestris TaxID=3711 RepID=M4DTX5_BRACM
MKSFDAVHNPSAVESADANVDDDGREKRTGTLMTASAHIITAGVGSGALLVAWGITPLGWVAGTLILVTFAVVNYYTSTMLADCYRSDAGARNYTYMDVVRSYLGGKVGKTSVTGTVVGVDVTASDKIWKAFQATGDIAFSYSFSTILDTLRSSPPENKVMKKATLAGVSTTTVFYILCGCMGYAAFGNRAPGDFLTDFGFYEPYWLINFDNACIDLHLMAAYQVFAQPIFQLVENKCNKAWPENNFINKEHSINIPFLGKWRINFFRLVWRTAYVILTTFVAVIFPFFNSILGLIGATAFWPLTVYFPVEMHISQRKAHPKFKKFRDEIFEEFDDLKLIFDKNIATGTNAIGLGETTDAQTVRVAETEKEQANCGEEFSFDVQQNYESQSSFFCSPSDDTLEKLPLRKRQKTSPLNKGDDLFTQKESVEEADELNTLTTITQKLFNLIEERETRQKQEAEQREAEKKKNNLWEAVKEVSDLEEHVRFDAVKLINQLGMKDVFISMSVDERYGWIKHNVIGF